MCIKVLDEHRLTLLKVVLDDALDIALLSVINDLVLQVLALGAHAIGCVHSLLQLIVLPSKYVVTVLAKSSVVVIAEVEWVWVSGLPLAVEWRGVPYNLVHELWNTDRMS